MTLIQKISTNQNTAVFSADKRLNSVQGVDDTFTKLTILGDNALAAGTGNVRAIDRNTHEVQIDLHQELAEFFSDQEVNDATLREFADLTKQKHDEYVQKYNPNLPNPGEPYFSFIFTYLTDEGIQDGMVRALISQDMSIDVDSPSYQCKTGALMCHGELAITEALMCSEYILLQELNNWQGFISVIAVPGCPPKPFGLISTDDAVTLCREVNLACFKKGCEILQQQHSTVSADCDICVLDETGISEV